MTTRARFTVRYTRGAGWWDAKVRGPLSLETAGRSLAQARKHVRMMLANEDVECPDGEIVEEVRLPPALAQALERVRVAREDLGRAAAAAAAAETEAVRVLGKRGLSVRDVADVLGLGRSRVCELGR